MNDKVKSDYGSDPLGNGQFRMVPSGDIVDRAERDRRLPLKHYIEPEILGMTWKRLEKMQGGGKLRK